jgi:hypothetical protein
MDETPASEINYLITHICRYLHGLSYQSLQAMPLSEVYEISNNLYKILQKENDKNG